MATKTPRLSPPKKIAKKTAVKPVIKKTVKRVAQKSAETSAASTVTPRYVYAVGRRKTAIAQVRLYPVGSDTEASDSQVNSRPLAAYFGREALKTIAMAPLMASGLTQSFRVTVMVRGGGLQGQADAVRLGIARCLLKHDPLLRATLKALGFLTRDARKVERKKPGLKKARRAPQWAKR